MKRKDLKNETELTKPCNAQDLMRKFTAILKTS